MKNSTPKERADEFMKLMDKATKKTGHKINLIDPVVVNGGLQSRANLIDLWEIEKQQKQIKKIKEADVYAKLDSATRKELEKIDKEIEIAKKKYDDFIKNFTKSKK